jgi:hypothetical protein
MWPGATIGDGQTASTPVRNYAAKARYIAQTIAAVAAQNASA